MYIVYRAETYILSEETDLRSVLDYLCGKDNLLFIYIVSSQIVIETVSGVAEVQDIPVFSYNLQSTQLNGNNAQV